MVCCTTHDHPSPQAITQSGGTRQKCQKPRGTDQHGSPLYCHGCCLLLPLLLPLLLLATTAAAGGGWAQGSGGGDVACVLLLLLPLHADCAVSAASPVCAAPLPLAAAVYGRCPCCDTAASCDRSMSSVRCCDASCDACRCRVSASTCGHSHMQPWYACHCVGCLTIPKQVRGHLHEQARKTSSCVCFCCRYLSSHAELFCDTLRLSKESTMINRPIGRACNQCHGRTYS